MKFGQAAMKIVGAILFDILASFVFGWNQKFYKISKSTFWPPNITVKLQEGRIKIAEKVLRGVALKPYIHKHQVFEDHKSFFRATKNKNDFWGP